MSKPIFEDQAVESWVTSAVKLPKFTFLDPPSTTTDRHKTVVEVTGHWIYDDWSVMPPAEMVLCDWKQRPKKDSVHVPRFLLLRLRSLEAECMEVSTRASCR